jgi:CheY-like chemotaxis protein
MIAAPPGRLIEILLVEDNPGDVRLTQEALTARKLPNRLHVVEDGQQAMQFLRHEAPYADAPSPDLVLLDLNLPKKNGREVLAEIKHDSTLQKIPVVVLSTSRADEDVYGAYQLNANWYVTKPVDLDQFIKVVKSIEDFWLKIVSLPPKDQDERPRD